MSSSLEGCLPGIGAKARTHHVHGGLTLAVIVSFLDEAEYLPILLASIERQTFLPGQLLLIDDGSQDASPAIAETFARHHCWARTLRRPVRPPRSDRLDGAPELCAFRWGVEQLHEPWDIVGKLDADLTLNDHLFETVADRFACRSELGMTGSYLHIRTSAGRLRLERNPPDHVRGPNRFYRRACYDQIQPIPTIIGWDTIDELTARMLGWRTESFLLPSGETVHLRPKGAYNGRLRACRRWGRGAWAYGAHPLWILLSGVRRVRDRPYVLGWLNYVFGWADAAVRGAPRADPEVRAQARREHLLELRRLLTALVHRSPARAMAHHTAAQSVKTAT